MRVNVYAEEMTDRVEIVSKSIDGHRFTGLRLYLELPATVNGQQYQGPFMHHPDDDNSSAVTFWGKRDLRAVLRKMLVLLDEHYEEEPRRSEPWTLTAQQVSSESEVAAAIGEAVQRTKFVQRQLAAPERGGIVGIQAAVVQQMIERAEFQLSSALNVIGGKGG